MPASRINKYYVDLKINSVVVRDDEITYIEVVKYLGNQLPTVFIDLTTQRSILQDNLMVEMSIIELEMGTANKSGGLEFGEKSRFFLASVERDAKQLKNGIVRYKIFGLADCRKYIELTQIMSLPKRETMMKFFQKVPGLTGGNGKGSGSLKLYIEDNLTGRMKDKQFWIQYDTSAIETVNQILVRGFIEDRPGGGKDEWVPVPVISFDSSGGPVMHLYDLKLRCKSFSPKTASLGMPLKFHFQRKGDTIVYNSAELNLLGAQHSVKYWKRKTASYNKEECLFKYKEVDPPKLFSDSLDYDEQQVFDGNGGLPSVFPMLQSGERYDSESKVTNQYDPKYASQRLQYTAALLSLMKVNINISVLDSYIDAHPIDMCHVTMQKSEKDVIEINQRLTAKYCITRVAHVYVGRRMNTYITASRDTYSPVETDHKVG